MNVLFVSGLPGDTQRYRCLHHQEQLALHGMHSVLRAADDVQVYSEATSYDLVILHRVVYSPLIAALIDAVHQQGKLVIFETDDLVFEPELYASIGYMDSLTPAQAAQFRQDLSGQAETVAHSDCVLTTTQFLAEVAKNLGKPAYVQRNAYSQTMLACAETAYTTRQQTANVEAKAVNAPLRIGYFSGTGSHNRDFAMITSALIEVMQRYPTVQLHLGGHLALPPALQPYSARIVHLPFVAWQALPTLLASIDINLAPLELDNRFCQAKSEIKYTEAALVGVPTIASPTDAFAYAIQPGVTGLLASTHVEWVAALCQLLEEPALRHALGEAARQQVLRDYSPQARSNELLATLQQIRQQHTPATPSVNAKWEQPVPPLKVFIAAGCPVGSVTLYRSTHLQEQFLHNHHQATVYPWDDTNPQLVEAALPADLIVLQRVAMSETVRRVIEDAHAQGVCVLFDVDDLIFEPELAAWNRTTAQLTPDELRLYHEGVARYLATLAASDGVLTASRVLAAYARQRGKLTFLHRNALGQHMQALGEQFFAQRDQRSLDAPIVIGYGSGTATHDVDFAQIAPALLAVLRCHPQVELWLVGPLQLPAVLEPVASQIRRFPLSDLAGWFALASQFDINLAPLESANIFCRAKSEIKFVEAGLLGVPTVASRIEPFEDAILPGQNGLLAGDVTEWQLALDQLVRQPALRIQLGQAARQTAVARYGGAIRATELSLILQSLAAAGLLQRRRPSVVVKKVTGLQRVFRIGQEARRLWQQTQGALRTGGLRTFYNEFHQYLRWQLNKRA